MGWQGVHLKPARGHHDLVEGRPRIGLGKPPVPRLRWGEPTPLPSPGSHSGEKGPTRALTCSLGLRAR